MTRRTPEWIALEDGEFVLRKERVDIVRRVFRETIEGHGRRTIARRLNLEGIPTFRGHERKVKPTGWQDSSIAKILHNRAVFGEFQPGTGTTKYGTHKPEGAPIKDYYPVVVDEEIFWQAQAVIASRRRVIGEDGEVLQRGAAGRRGNGVAHLLIGLGRCDRCRGPMHQINKGARPKGGLYLECSTARRKAGCDNTSRWRVDVIERRLLKHLSYIDVDAVMLGDVQNGEADRVTILKTKLSDLEQRTDNVAAMIEVAKQRDPARLEQYRRLVEEADAVRDELAEAEKHLAQAAADPGLKARLADAIDLSRAMDEAEGEERTAIRTRLAEQLRQLVEVIRFDHELGVDAVLKARPDIPADQIPFVYGTEKVVPWRLSLDYDTEPHGAEPWVGQDEPEVPLEVQMPGLARKLAERKAGAR